MGYALSDRVRRTPHILECALKRKTADFARLFLFSFFNGAWYSRQVLRSLSFQRHVFLYADIQVALISVFSFLREQHLIRYAGALANSAHVHCHSQKRWLCTDDVKVLSASPVLRASTVEQQIPHAPWTASQICSSGGTVRLHLHSFYNARTRADVA